MSDYAEATMKWAAAQQRLDALLVAFEEAEQDERAAYDELRKFWLDGLAPRHAQGSDDEVTA